ncbi:hypothetical protein Tco_0363786 [Tanacetum coccineum]
MIEPEKPLKKKDQILIDEEIAQKLQTQLNTELEEEEKLAQEQEVLTVKEKSKLFVELMDKRKKHFARLRAEEQRRKPPTKAQKRNQMCTYLKNMAGFTHSQLKNKSFDEVQKAFDKTMGWIDSFVSMDSEVMKGGKEKDEGGVTIAKESSSKRAGTKLEQERIKKQKIDDDQEEAKMKKHMEIVVNEEEITIDAIPLATKPPIIEDLETLWKFVKAKHGSSRPEEAYEKCYGLGSAVPPTNTDASSLQELDLLFSHLYEEYFTTGNQSVSKPFTISDNLQQQDIQPSLNVQPTIESITPPTNVNIEENNTDQAADTQFEPYEFINPLCTLVQEIPKSSSRNVDTSNM